jgi:hypothetical protein
MTDGGLECNVDYENHQSSDHASMMFHSYTYCEFN